LFQKQEHLLESKTHLSLLFKKKFFPLYTVLSHCFLKFLNNVADPDLGSGIGSLFDPWIRDPGWEKVSIRIRDPG
jgi:hypothetical protein